MSEVRLRDWVRQARELGASDLHLESDGPLVVRVRGQLQPLGPMARAADLMDVARELLGAEAWGGFTARGSADVSREIAGTRCRINLFKTIRGMALAIRLLAQSVRDLKSCNLHADLRRLVEASTGLVVVSGPTGSGKSTTLAALIEEINAVRACNIICLDSPLEYVYSSRRSFIRQREIPTHSPSFEQGITDALRENPDVLVISEMRTPEVMRLTLNAAETGHLVLATMHSANCAEALTRICMSFAPELQGSIRAQLADCLVGVLCQRLEFLSAQHLRVPRCELLIASTAARGTIRAGQFAQLPNVIQSGAEEGMWSFDRYQRWLEHHKDWVKPMAAPAATVRQATPAPGARPSSTTPSGAVPAGAGSPSADVAAPAPIEIAEEGLDLAELAELARKLEQRSP